MYRKFLISVIVLGIAAIMGIQFLLYQQALPNHITLVKGEQSRFSFLIPASADVYREQEAVPVSNINMSKNFTLKNNALSSYTMDVKLFGMVPLKKVQVNTITETKVLPSGKAIGIYMETDGVLVLGTTALRDRKGNHCYPAKSVIQKGDYIVKADQTTIHYKSELLSYIKKKKTARIVLTLRRKERLIKVAVKPVLTKSGYKCGIWIRDDTQGLGTLTCQSRQGHFYALGHGVSDVDTGELLNSRQGRIYEAEVSYVVPGTSGHPGELVGSIDYATLNWLGEIKKNQEHGISGQGNAKFMEYAKEQEELPVAMKQEVKKGKALIQSYVSGEKKQYEIEIEKVSMGSDSDAADMVIRVTDPELIKLTGGIVQGMSGSPILQNGKIIGAVTHVFVNDPTKGYGVFIENMLKK